MLRIRKIRVEINTPNGIYGIDETLYDGLNLLTSNDNTHGKSSILAAIYYCLGLEQILGGTAGIGSKVLTSALKSNISDGACTYPVIESCAYLEIFNGQESVTIRRYIKRDGKDSRLITVFFGDYGTICSQETLAKDYYVNVQNSATSEQGFHTFLEDYLHLRLPLVQCTDGSERKLYLQLVFSAMFIEQKHGWSDILSGMPYLGLRDARKRVVEFILGLETIKNEKESSRLSLIKQQIEEEWNNSMSIVQSKFEANECVIENIPARPRILTDIDYARMTINTFSGMSITDEIAHLNEEYSTLRKLKPRVTDNFDALSEELSATEIDIKNLEHSLESILNEAKHLDASIDNLSTNLSIVSSDLRNNEDAARLQQYGSSISDDTMFAKVCPTCKQHIQDNLLLFKGNDAFMNIEENIRHLHEQKKMLEFSLDSRRKNMESIQQRRRQMESELLMLRRLARTLRSDLNTTTDTEASEAIMLKKIGITNKIECLSNLCIERDIFIDKMLRMVEKWRNYLEQKAKLPKNNISEDDKEKVALFKKYYIDNLQKYHYSSVSTFADVDVPYDTLLPTIDGFDMKFDSSASDNVRVIWAFVMALLQTSLLKGGNHPGVLILDEPGQQSIVSKDLRSFINSVVELGASCQIITALTLNSKDVIDIVDSLAKESYHRIAIGEKAFTKQKTVD